MLNSIPSGMHRQRGVSLIEMMIALVAGLVVSGAALALVLATMKSNSETIKATRLTQELRATADVIARDLRRARSVTDPIANVDVTSSLQTCNTITLSPTATSPKTCVIYGYDCTSTGGDFKAIGFAGNKIRLTTSATAAPSCPTSSTGTQLSSNAVKINSFAISSTSADVYTISLTGQFANDPSATPLIRTFSQIVRIRSAAVN